MSALLAELGAPEGVRQLSSAADGERLIELFHQCYDLLSSKSYSIAHQLHVSHTIRYLISFLGLLPARQEIRSHAYIEQAMLLMQERLETQMTIEELVVHTRISKQHLHHLFKHHTGYSPIDYYLRMKMQRACQLLDLTEYSIKQISLTLGIADPYYFSRLFKKVIGLSPSAYRGNPKG
ncbi:helix-turn-helix domain-containing protein [Paenibacillus sp. 1P07SE]|uniref:helix-turn-helix domain-containing protein n=1 Tax=Paenibacillus sp. 1P07SE TaxID=3132209 RepID=UPI0039A57264